MGLLKGIFGAVSIATHAPSRRTGNNAKAGLSRNSTAGPRPGTLIPGRVMERLSGPFHRDLVTLGRSAETGRFWDVSLGSEGGSRDGLAETSGFSPYGGRTRSASTPGPRPALPLSKRGTRGRPFAWPRCRAG